jgi:hypothetical protein
MYFFGSVWHHWALGFKIATPILHVAFASAQLHGTRILFKMWRKEKRLLNDEKTRRLDPVANWDGAGEAVALPGNVAMMPSGIIRHEKIDDQR